MKPAYSGFGLVSGQHETFPFGCLAYNMHYSGKKKPKKTGKLYYQSTRTKGDKRVIPMIYMDPSQFSKDSHRFLNTNTGRITNPRDLRICLDVFPLQKKVYKEHTLTPKVLSND